MCDTVAVVGADGALFGKCSDREPGEAQGVDVVPAATWPAGARLRCTHLEVPQASATRGLLLSRPAWMWGAEMGANDAGVVAGNEAVFTRLPVAKAGLTGMDLLRLALERAASAEEAVEVVIGLLAEHAQGGRMGFAHAGFRYHSSFIFADAQAGLVLETAGQFWAVERFAGARTISNVLSIGRPQRAHPDAEAFARSRGWVDKRAPFDFARAFGAPLLRWASGGVERAACTLGALAGAAPDEAGLRQVMAALRSHGGRQPWEGVRTRAPCAHASWSPAKSSGQTTGAMASRLWRGGAAHHFTGTSAPCLSVFKPVAVGDAPPGALPHASPDAGLWWTAERLHRAVLQGYTARKAAFEAQRGALEARAARASTRGEREGAWAEHLAALPEWTQRVRAAPGGEGGALFRAWWRRREL